ncbi:MAG: hypothetical protein R2856_11925 [Caldilineaceae bacterium]
MLGMRSWEGTQQRVQEDPDYMMYPPRTIPTLAAIAGRNEEAVAEAAALRLRRSYYTDWLRHAGR